MSYAPWQKRSGLNHAPSSTGSLSLTTDSSCNEIIPSDIEASSTMMKDQSKSVVESLKSDLMNVINNDVKKRNILKKQQEIDKIVSELEDMQQEFKELPKFPELFDTLDGIWELQWSNNAINSPTGKRNINPLISLTNVIQLIDGRSETVENILNFGSPVFLGGSVRLIHKCTIQSQASPALLAIDLQSVAADGPLGKQSLDLLGPSWSRRGFFSTTYIDEDIRISRGEFQNELRVFKRVL